MGSSPRARGTYTLAWAVLLVGRLIPACAGNISTPALTRGFPKAHPRVRGEHAQLSAHSFLVSGSSPRARGTSLAHTLYRCGLGLIPACAGNMHPLPPAPTPHSAHPRVRGEHLVWLSLSAASSGSSPRARGTWRAPSDTRPHWRLIPACAGNMCAPAARCRSRRAHPRVRGEHGTTSGSCHDLNGSSPRARGTLSTPRTARTSATAHPRVRGEHMTDHPSSVCG